MKIDNKTEKEITFGVMAAALAMTLGVHFILIQTVII